MRTHTESHSLCLPLGVSLCPFSILKALEVFSFSPFARLLWPWNPFIFFHLISLELKLHRTLFGKSSLWLLSRSLTLWRGILGHNGSLWAPINVALAVSPSPRRPPDISRLSYITMWQYLSTSFPNSCMAMLLSMNINHWPQLRPKLQQGHPWPSSSCFHTDYITWAETLAFILCQQNVLTPSTRSSVHGRFVCFTLYSFLSLFLLFSSPSKAI